MLLKFYTRLILRKYWDDEKVFFTWLTVEPLEYCVNADPAEHVDLETFKVQLSIFRLIGRIASWMK